jgi:hypothetical protein
MERLVRNLRYIEEENAKCAVNDSKFNIEIVPLAECEVSQLFGKIDTFSSFYSYVMGYSVERAGRFKAAATYMVNKIKNAPLDELIRAYYAIEAEKRGKKREKRQALRDTKVFDEEEIDQLHIESSAYMGECTSMNFYKCPLMVAQHYLEIGEREMARRYAHEALSLSGRTSTPSGLRECREFIEELERKERRIF